MRFCLFLQASLVTSDPCFIDSFSPPSGPPGTLILIETGCATNSDIYCHFAQTHISHAQTVNSTHVVCETPFHSYWSEPLLGRISFGIAVGSEIPLKNYVFRVGTFDIATMTTSTPSPPPSDVEPSDVDDSPNLDGPLFVSISRNISLLSGGPNVVVTVTNSDASTVRYRCIWKDVDTWAVIASVDALPYSSNTILCGITPGVSRVYDSIFYVERNGQPVKGGGAPFSFVQSVATESDNCFDPDGLCAVGGSLETNQGYSIETPFYN